jgi:hypothetical protein
MQPQDVPPPWPWLAPSARAAVMFPCGREHQDYRIGVRATGFVARIAQRDLTPVELIWHGLDIINPGSQR